MVLNLHRGKFDTKIAVREIWVSGKNFTGDDNLSFENDNLSFRNDNLSFRNDNLSFRVEKSESVGDQEFFLQMSDSVLDGPIPQNKTKTNDAMQMEVLCANNCYLLLNYKERNRVMHVTHLRGFFWRYHPKKIRKFSLQRASESFRR